MGDLSTPRRMQAADRRRSLLDAASRAFAEHGYERARLEEIAAEAGVTKAIVYRHFESKDELYCAVAAEACRELDAAMAEALSRPQDGPRELLTRAVSVWFRFVGAQPAAFVILAASRQPVEAAARMVDETRDRIVARLAAAFPSKPPIPMTPDQWRPVVEGAVRAIVGGAETIAQWWADQRPYDVEIARFTFTSLVWMGVERLLAGEVWLPD